MDRRTKFILLVIASILLLGAVIWLIVIPTLRPVLPIPSAEQPPALGTPGAPQFQINGTEGTESQNGAGGAGVVTVPAQTALTSDQQRILDLSRQAGILSERIESGSSANGFENLDNAKVGVSASLVLQLDAMKERLLSAHPPTGQTYLTIATRLVEIPENPDIIRGDAFSVRVQMQVQIRDGGQTSTEYRESTVTFGFQGGKWLATAYDVKPFTP
ncbi:hypothetical protein HS096_01235 [candidate division WWE3 bacterium]|uniref:Uncharacterized protein n=1 Tax=candidate division WWE3 bacterium TaxID=2053526 RepID=A0A928TV74_UNCKA|nr:hypothetical protein [candidate division WWE3 bacterium]